jgi:hypothetical protein
MTIKLPVCPSAIDAMEAVYPHTLPNLELQVVLDVPSDSGKSRRVRIPLLPLAEGDVL